MKRLFLNDITNEVVAKWFFLCHSERSPQGEVKNLKEGEILRSSSRLPQDDNQGIPQQSHNKGQATTELAIMGSIILMVLLFLAQQIFNFNARQGLEMYTFREALRMSKDTGRAIDLTVSRDIISPSFFAGLSRQRITSSSQVEANPWDLYVAEEGSPQDVDTLQLIQMGESMIQNGYFVQIPPTKMKVNTSDGKNNKWQWRTSAIREFDQISNNPVTRPKDTASYTYQTQIREDAFDKQTSTDLASSEHVKTSVTFQDRLQVSRDYATNDWEGKVRDSSQVAVENIPQDADIILDENISRTRTIRTPH